ncbi:S9 family peptidase [Chitinophaga horti]|uniref:S9 family peptidase n=1 Tax=Chitinophaga horti TaxID=2920382 RepID=A0ABY6J5Y0_9BACT|nr:S9 family peptidase [Chitinophaga horti]UYQ95088.1 S9 family peptidase [Chitinophaga horti]
MAICCLSALNTAQAQMPGEGFKWTSDGQSFYSLENDGIYTISLKDLKSTPALALSELKDATGKSLSIRDFAFSADEKQVLIFANTRKVWRYHTRGDYWLYNIATKKLQQLGKGRPEASLMFAKFSPDGKKVAYVSDRNIYVEDVATGIIQPLTKDGTRRFINGTFDWVYEEEFGCRDGFRWSPDSKSIAFWQIDATKIRDFYMINNTDSIYSHIVPVEYPKVGQSPSACRVGVIDINTKKTTWLQVPGDAQQHYIPRMEWLPGKNELILQQLDRKQQVGKLMLAQAATGKTQTIWQERDSAWLDVKSRWDDDKISGWDWLQGGKSFLWVSEKDGWRHLYSITADGKQEKLITKGNYDVIKINRIDEANNAIYFMASPDNATQAYLYKVNLDGTGTAQRLTPADAPGTHEYQVSPNGAFAFHSMESHLKRGQSSIVSLPDHRTIRELNAGSANAGQNVSFFQVTTADGVTMDGWMVKPLNFDSTKKYPVVFYVYGEPAGTTVTDNGAAGYNRLYAGNMAKDGYIYISLDNRGTPAPKGRAWRKSIYRKVGIINARDQAMGAKEIMKWPFVDASRIAVWGWSGGGSMTLNLLFQYPEIYSTGISIAAVGNQLTYDNIYQERYMGLPQENREDFVKGSPITYAANLKGKLLYIHGTGDDNVHYQNAEMLINELIKNGKQFQMMAYPNRTHSINEGAGTTGHLSQLYTNFLKEHCPPGGR